MLHGAARSMSGLDMQTVVRTAVVIMLMQNMLAYSVSLSHSLVTLASLLRSSSSLPLSQCLFAVCMHESGACSKVAMPYCIHRRTRRPEFLRLRFGPVLGSEELPFVFRILDRYLKHIGESVRSCSICLVLSRT